MKKLIKFKHVILFFILVFGVMFLNSCVTYQPFSYAPVTVPDIIKMSKDSMSSKAIIHEIRKSHTAYTLKASEYAKLQKEGVADSVVNFMQKTHLNLIRQQQQMDNYYYMYPPYGGYWYGGLGYGWPYGGYMGWNWGPSIILRGGGGNFHGGEIHRGERGERGER